MTVLEIILSTIDTTLRSAFVASMTSPVENDRAALCLAIQAAEARELGTTAGFHKFACLPDYDGRKYPRKEPKGCGHAHDPFKMRCTSCASKRAFGFRPFVCSCGLLRCDHKRLTRSASRVYPRYTFAVPVPSISQFRDFFHAPQLEEDAENFDLAKRLEYYRGE